MIRPLCLAIALLGAGCVTPRSMTLGATAAPIGRGATEVGVFGGLAYTAQTNPTTTSTNIAGETITNQTTAKGFSLPAAEANIQRGFNDHIALNVHASPAGIQPGLKWTINTSKIAHVALLPAIGMGFGSSSQSTLSAGVDGHQEEVNPTTSTSFTFLLGFKVLVSHRSGFYAGLGYDFVFHRLYTSTITGPANVTEKSESTTVNLMHQIMAAVGMDIALGPVHLRPEIAFSVVPLINTTWSNRVGTTESSLSSGGGFAFSIMPGFSIAVASPPAAKVEDAEEDDTPSKRRPSEDDDDEDDDAPRKKRSKKGADDERPRSRSRDDED